MHRIFAASVWAPDGVSAEDWRFRNIFRACLPAIDILFVYFGVVGWINGVASVTAAAGASWQTWWSAFLAVSALVALVGVSFPHLWPVELSGKLPLIGLVTVYIAVLFDKSAADPNVMATAGLCLILIILPIWRVGDLGVVWWKQQQQRRDDS